MGYICTWIGCLLWQFGRRTLREVLCQGGERLRAEGLGAMFHLFTSLPGCIFWLCFGWWMLGWLLLFLWFWMSPRFFAWHLLWANRASSFSRQQTFRWPSEPWSAHGMSSKKTKGVWCKGSLVKKMLSLKVVCYKFCLVSQLLSVEGVWCERCLI